MSPEQRVVLLVGLPGSGKSTWAASQGVTPLSSDEMRRLLRDDCTDQGIHDVVFRLLRQFLRLRIQLGAPVTYIDATNLMRKYRKPFVKIALAAGCRCEAVYFDVPLEVCLQRNASRERIVPEAAIRAMAARLQPPVTSEGFAVVQVVS